MSLIDQQIAAAEQEFLDLFERGPSDDRGPGLTPLVGDQAPDLRLRDSRGEGRTLSEFWRDRPALLLFWRHYGCSCGFGRAERLREELAGLLDAGANVAIVGQAEPERSAAYAEEHGLECPVLSDPEYEAYRAYGLADGQVSQVLFDAPEDFWSHSRETGEQLAQSRREQGRPLVDNPWLLPGEFVVDSDGVIRLAYRYQYCDDFPNPLVLTTAIKMAPAALAS